ncbi:MAG: NERD domain-containing protein [Bacilli bacterium]
MVKLAITLTVIALLVAALIVCIFSDDIKTFGEKKRHKNHVYTVLHNYAEDYDQLLINNVHLLLSENKDEITTFDHILICDKYAYLIQDFSAQGAVYGNLEDTKLFLKNFKGGATTFANPIYYNLQNIYKMERNTNIASSDHFFISVIVYNDSLIVPQALHKKDGGNWFIPVSQLYKTIKEAEKDNVGSMKSEFTELITQRLKEKSDSLKAEESKKVKK